MIPQLSAMPLAVAEGIEIEKVVMVVVFLLVAFLQWLFKLMAQAKENRERDKKAPTAEEIEARRRSWENQTRPLPGPPAVPAAPPAIPQTPGTTGGPMAELMENLRRSLEEVSPPKHGPSPHSPTPAPAPAPRPQVPPALPHTPSWAKKAQPATPAPAPAPSRSAVPSVPLPAEIWGAAEIHTPVVLGSSVEHLVHAKHQGRSQHQSASSRNASRHHRHPLSDLLRTTIGYRQAFILREVLGPCKALEDDESVKQ